MRRLSWLFRGFGNGFVTERVDLGNDWTLRILVDILSGILAFVGNFYYLCAITGRVTSGNTHNRFRFLVFYQAVRSSKNFKVFPLYVGK